MIPRVDVSGACRITARTLVALVPAMDAVAWPISAQNGPKRQGAAVKSVTVTDLSVLSGLARRRAALIDVAQSGELKVESPIWRLYPSHPAFTPSSMALDDMPAGDA